MNAELSPALQKRLEILKKLDTKPLLDRVKQLEDQLLDSLTEQTQMYYGEYEYTINRGGDCVRVKELEAELLLKVPDNVDDKKLTVAAKAAWLVSQRNLNPALKAAIEKQLAVNFQLENVEIRVRIIREQLLSTRAILALRTAQIQFLSGCE